MTPTLRIRFSVRARRTDGQMHELCPLSACTTKEVSAI